MATAKVTRLTQLVLGLTVIGTLSNGVMLRVQGTQEIENAIRYVNTSTGAVVRIGSGTTNIHDGRWPIAINCVGSSGSNVDTVVACSMPSPSWSGTGVVTALSFEIQRSETGALKYDIGYATSATTGSGTEFGDNVLMGTGSLFYWTPVQSNNTLSGFNNTSTGNTVTGAMLWNGDRTINVASPSHMGTGTSRFFGRLRVWGYDFLPE